MIIFRNDLDDMEKRYRARLINSLSGFKSANLVGTADKDGNLNLSIVSSVFHIGANPPLMGMISRPHSVSRDTLENILVTEQFTLNHVDEKHYMAAHQTSARYGRERNEFEETGLTAAFSDGFEAPHVAESPLSIGLRLVETQTLAVNQTVMVIGEVVWFRVAESAVQTDGYIDIESLGTVAVSGLDSYHTTHRLNRLSYAKPDAELSPLDLTGARKT